MAEVVATVTENKNHEPSKRPALTIVSEAALQETQIIPGVAEIAGAKVDYTVELPEEVTDPYPALYVPGFLGVEEGYDALRHQTAARGKVAVTFRPPRTQAWRKALHPVNLRHPERLPSQAVWSVIKDMNSKHILNEDGWDLFCHSWGGVAGTNAALRKPEHVRSLILLASTGISNDYLPHYIPRIAPFMISEVAKGIFNGELRQFEDEFKTALSGLHYMLRSPRRTISEGVAASLINLLPHIPVLRAAGIGTGLGGFSNDKLVPLQRALRAASHLVDYAAPHDDEAAGHSSPQSQAAAVAQYCLNILAKLHSA